MNRTLLAFLRAGGGGMKEEVPVAEDHEQATPMHDPHNTARRLRGTGIALGESVRMQAHMLDQIGQAVIATDPDGMVIYANRFAGELYAWPPEEMLGQSILTLTPDDPTTLQTAAEIMARLRQGESWTGETLVQSRDGRVFPVLITNSTLFNEQGEVIGLIGVSVDISERKRAEETLEQRERDQRDLASELQTERARLVIAQAVAGVGSWETDLATMKIVWSAETHRVFGTRPEQFEPTHERFLELVHPDERNLVDEAFHRALQTIDPSAIEHRIVLHDGRTKYVDERWQVFQDGEGRPVRAIGTVHDITERKLAEQELARTHRAIREQASMLDAATDAIFVRDIDHRITYWNRSAERLYGWTAAEAIGQFAFELLHYGDPEAFQTATRTVLGAGHWSGELRKRSKAGAHLTVESRWTLLLDDSGRPRSILAINTDVTERRKLEAQFLRAQRMESIGTLAGGIAHDLNNILAPIVMGVGVLKRFEEREKMLAIIGNIERSAKRGTDLVKQVLSFGRGVEGSRLPVRLESVISEIEAIVGSTFPKNITLERAIVADLRLIVGDPTQLTQVVLNLCVNARDAMPEGGHLTLSARNIEIDEQYVIMNKGIASAGHYVLLEVADDGCGMSREVLDRVFDPFFSTKEASKGTGLGLSTVNGIVRSHGGFVNVYSEVGVGSSFKVYLPAGEAVSQAGAVTAAAETLPRGKNELILIVDDEPSILSVTAQTLETFGYRTLVAADGAEAIGLYALRRDEIALVITDMMMPVMDGPALIAALYRINPAVLVIGASGLGTTENVARARHSGVTQFLAKPFSAGVMLTMIRKVLDGEDPPASGASA